MDPDVSAAPATGLRTVRAGSMAAVAAEISAAGLGLLTGLMTAKSLGPDGKGLLATLCYVAIVVASSCELGLGEAGVNAASAGTRTIDAALATTVTTLVLTSTVGTLAFAAIVVVRYGEVLGTVPATAIWVGAAVPMIAASDVLRYFLLERRGFVASGMSKLALGLVTAVFTYVLVLLMDLDVSGAAAAFTFGWFASVVVTVAGMRRRGLSFRPSLDRSYLRQAMRIGFPVQVSFLLTVVATRGDLLLVDAFVGIEAAGQYSVAVSVASVVIYMPAVLANTTYARLAGAALDEMARLLSHAIRLAVLLTATTAVALACAVPMLLPVAFGPGFRPAIWPTIILLVGGPAWAAQWMLCKGRLARGDGSLFVRSYAVTVVAMIASDVVLIPLLDVEGAALGSVLATVAGLLVALRAVRDVPELRARQLLVPTRAELAQLGAMVGSARSRIARRAA